MVSHSEFKHEYINAYIYTEKISSDYEVFVNGEKIPVYTCRVSKFLFNRPWPGHQREINQTEIASFVNIVSDEHIDIKVKVNKKCEKMNIRPYSKNINFKDEDGFVSFSLDSEAQLVLCGEDLHNCLYIFNSKPIKCEEPESVTHYFGPGVHMPGKITLKDNESVYVDKDALVFGCIYAENAKNIRIFGNGLFDDSAEERFANRCYENFTNGNIKFYDCENISIEGVMFRNSAIWCVNIFHCFDVVIDNIKVFGQWRYNSDGVDVVNSQRVVLKNSFIHSFDDAVTIKGIDRYIETDCTDIITENCVLWCGWGKACQLGFETACREFKNIIFRNCDIISAGFDALSIQNGDCAEISDVLFENINIEFNSFDTEPVLQETDESVYDAYDKPFYPAIINFMNVRFRDAYADDNWGVPIDHAPVDLTGIDQTNIHDITVKNIKIYSDKPMEKSDGKYKHPVYVKSVVEGVKFYNIAIENITVNGEKIGIDDVVSVVEDVENFTFR